MGPAPAAEAHSNVLFALHYLDWTPRAVFAAHVARGRAFGAQHPEAALQLARPREPGQPGDGQVQVRAGCPRRAGAPYGPSLVGCMLRTFRAANLAYPP